MVFLLWRGLQVEVGRQLWVGSGVGCGWGREGGFWGGWEEREQSSPGNPRSVLKFTERHPPAVHPMLQQTHWRMKYETCCSISTIFFYMLCSGRFQEYLMDWLFKIIHKGQGHISEVAGGFRKCWERESNLKECFTAYVCVPPQCRCEAEHSDRHTFTFFLHYQLSTLIKLHQLLSNNQTVRTLQNLIKPYAFL